MVPTCVVRGKRAFRGGMQSADGTGFFVQVSLRGGSHLIASASTIGDVAVCQTVYRLGKMIVVYLNHEKRPSVVQNSCL